MSPRWISPLFVLLLSAALAGSSALGFAQSGANVPPAVGDATLHPGPTGWQARRPVMAGACPHACPFGELGAFVQQAMKPLGYGVVLCGNCGGAEGPRLVARHAAPPALTPLDRKLGMTERVDAPINFGVTLPFVLEAAYRGDPPYSRDGPYPNLRLIARLEDPMYLLVAVSRGVGVSDLSEVRRRRLPVRILASGPMAHEVLAAYGLTPETLAEQGASVSPLMGADRDAPFDILIGDLAGPSNNWETNSWTVFSQREDLNFLQLPEPLLQKLAAEPEVVRVTVHWGLLRGVTAQIATVARSGEAIFTTADAPNQAVYDLAKAIDQARGDLRWYDRPYAYDTRTVWRGNGVPLHPGAARWYVEQSYMRAPPPEAR